ncbi:2-nonaprenyl-3-methyl-6-methoxy-1,4-benzoquinol hydroxylase [Striga asiatica]|uniref:2-nonaprenyl-3-methyl-6-methoxy-1,4-benzoquinol hydroxylase n=1 Tax=Striga asiatica TaxID=4170 RepID=A0A5A7RGN8_STRAF|nr:2-nonaprenyl-3-methyl-6-methoxy-1,4-benzoquinol hydroxylase [Striga asiatica]
MQQYDRSMRASAKSSGETLREKPKASHALRDMDSVAAYSENGGMARVCEVGKEMCWNQAPITASMASRPFLISLVLSSFIFCGEPEPQPRGSNQSPPGYPTSVPVNLLLGKMGSVLTLPGLMMSAQRRPSAQPMRISSTMKSVVVSVKYSCSPAVYHDGVLRIPIFVRNSGMKMPAAPSIAHLQWTSSACWFHFKLSGSDALETIPKPRGSKPKSPGRLQQHI